MDMFTDPLAEVLARLAALEAAVFAKAPKPAKETVGETLNAAWQRWEAHRRGTKGWTLTARSLNMMKLRELSGVDGELAMKIVNQSIERGWTGLFPMKVDERAPAPVQHKTVKQALAPTEDRLTAQLRWLRNQVERGVMTESEFNAEAEKARERMG